MPQFGPTESHGHLIAKPLRKKKKRILPNPEDWLSQQQSYVYDGWIQTKPAGLDALEGTDSAMDPWTTSLSGLWTLLPSGTRQSPEATSVLGNSVDSVQFFELMVATCSEVSQDEWASVGTREDGLCLWLTCGHTLCRSKGFFHPPRGPGGRGKVSFKINMKPLKDS